MKLKKILLPDLIAAPYNPRKIGAEALAGLTESIKRFGLVQPIVWNERTNRVVAGHQRIKALEKIGASEAEVIVVDLDEANEKALNVSLNNQFIAGEFTDDLPDILDELKEVMEEGFDDLRLDALEGMEFAKEPIVGNTDPDEVPDAPVEPISKTGDLWLLGDHRLLCGDCTKVEDVARLMGGEMAAMLVTSPPYWANQEYDNKPGIEGARLFMTDVAKTVSPFVNRRIVINTGYTNEKSIGEKRSGVRVALDWEWHRALSAAGWELRHRRIWVKGGALIHNSPVSDLVDESCEMLMTFFRPGKNEGGQERVGEPWAQCGYWEFPGVGKNEVGDDHPCPYPAELPGRFVRLYSKESDVVIEPFSGSGTTIIAAEMAGRKCYAVEIEPRYVDVAVKRWEEFTGKKAILDKAGA